ncbi:MAG TPA: hypothetical protein VFD94_01545 [Jatrophihabitans sp.]|nr:hypothetical protein [Jatrophihabitans sp.]
MEPNGWTPPPVPAATDGPMPARRRRGLVAGVGLVGAGVVAGAIVGTTYLSGAATTPTPAAGSSSTSRQEGPGHAGPGHGLGLGLAGTVTAVGTSSVTIKTSTATTSYQVNGNSDIDKNGEAKLSDLKVGDAVRFNLTSGNVIDKLHAGDEALDRPQGHPGEGSGG